MRTTMGVYKDTEGRYSFTAPCSEDDIELSEELGVYKFLGTVELDIQEPRKLVTKEALTTKTVHDFNERTMLVSGIIPPDAINPRIVYEVKE